MKALILNSGIGKRMGTATRHQPKCMTELYDNSTILSRQLSCLTDIGISEVVMTIGPFEKKLVEYCDSLDLPVNITFVKNENYRETNYIYSIYCARDYLKDDDIIIIHGDLVFDFCVLQKLIQEEQSCMVVSSTTPLPQKDFKAVLLEERIYTIGIDFFENAISAQPMYKLNLSDWTVWLEKIDEYCIDGNVSCYAENAFNDISNKCKIYPLDVKNELCGEIDTVEDLEKINIQLRELQQRKVYMCFSTDIIHSGHISIIKKAARLGKLTIGILSDEAVVSYKRFPLLPFDERKALFEQFADVNEVVEQRELSYREILERLKPDLVVHGDDWKIGIQKTIRNEVLEVLQAYGGKLVEFPYADDKKYRELQEYARIDLSIPDIRRSRLKKCIEMKGLVTAMEAHSGITGLIVEKTVVEENGKAFQFDAMWISSLCDSTAKGKPDIELVDMTSRFRTIDDIMEVTTKPIIFDGDTGGLTEHFVYTVKTLERMGVSAIIIEDKTGLKKNSLFGTEVAQTQDSIENFSNKIRAGKRAQRTKDFMIIARIESLILERGQEDALLRARAFVEAGADGIMIHSRKKEPDEIFTFVEAFRKENKKTPIVVVPTSFNMVTEQEFKERGVNVVIYANQLTRSGFPAMKNAAETILRNHRAKESDDMCMSIKEILTLVPEEF